MPGLTTVLMISDVIRIKSFVFAPFVYVNDCESALTLHKSEVACSYFLYYEHS